MKTVSTKLDNKVHNRFIEICNEDGKCQSEFLRDMIEAVCEDCSDVDNLPSTSQDLEIKVEDVPEDPIPMAHGKILDDDGNVIGTF